MANGMAWRFAEKWGCQLISFVVSIIIARIIDPDAYGIIALTNSFITILNVFIDSGLGNSLIQKKDADDLDFSTVFYTNVFICLLAYAILYFSAPFISSFYSSNELCLILRVYGIVLIFSSIKNVQQAYIAKNYLFKNFFYSSLLGTIGAGVIGVFLAVRGYGVWALVSSSLFDVAIDTLVMMFTIKWKPKPLFSFERLKGLFNYGWKLFVSSIIIKLYKKMYSFVIGKTYSSKDLAYYDKGQTVTGKITTSIEDVVESVLFPFLSNEQDNEKNVKNIARTTLKANFFIMTPILVGLASVSYSFIPLLLTEKWNPAIPFVQLYCISGIVMPLKIVNQNITKSQGRSDITLKLEIIKKVFGILVFILSIRYGVLAIGLSMVVSNYFDAIVSSLPNKQLVNYSFLEQVKDITPSFIISIIMGLCVYAMNYLKMSLILLLISQIFAGVIIYILLSIIFRIDVFYSLISFIRKGE